MQSTKNLLIAFSLISAVAAGCGDDDGAGTQLGNNTAGNNTAVNNTDPNNTDPNNTSVNNTAVNNTDPNNTTVNNTTPTNNTTGNNNMGALANVTFRVEQGDNFVTGGIIDVMITVEGTIRTLSLRIDGEHWSDATGIETTQINTSGMDEGQHVLTAVWTEEDGGPEYTSTTSVTFTVDTTNPSVADRTPAINEVNVNIREPMMVQFTEPMAHDGSATGISLDVGGTSVALDAQWADDSTVFLTATGSAALPAQGTLTVAGLSDLAGNTIAQAQWSFGLAAYEHNELEAGALHSRHAVLNGMDVEVTAGLVTGGVAYRVYEYDPATNEYAQVGADLPINGTFYNYDVFSDGTTLYLFNFFKAPSASRGSMEVHTFDGTAWSSIGGPTGTISTSAAESDVSIAANGGNVMIAVADELGGLYTYLYSGGSWAAANLPTKNEQHRNVTRLLPQGTGGFSILEARCTSVVNGTCANTQLSVSLHGTSGWTPSILPMDITGSCDRFRDADLAFHDSKFHLIVAKRRQCTVTDVNPYQTETYAVSSNQWSALNAFSGGSDLQPDPTMLGLSASAELRTANGMIYAMVHTQEDMWIYRLNNRGWGEIEKVASSWDTDRNTASKRLQEGSLGIDRFGRPVPSFTYGAIRHIWRLIF